MKTWVQTYPAEEYSRNYPGITKVCNLEETSRRHALSPNAPARMRLHRPLQLGYAHRVRRTGMQETANPGTR